MKGTPSGVLFSYLKFMLMHPQKNEFEYREPKPHNHVKNSQQRDVYMTPNSENRICLSFRRQNRQVMVTLEFPEQSDLKAEQEFISRLKAVYLEKIQHAYDLQTGSLIKNGAGQKGGLALQSPTTKEKEEKNNG